jgi:hypothetical protein
MGFRAVPRETFLLRLVAGAALPGKRGRWQVEADAKRVADWKPGKSAEAAGGAKPVAASPEEPSRAA